MSKPRVDTCSGMARVRFRYSYSGSHAANTNSKESRPFCQLIVYFEKDTLSLPSPSSPCHCPHQDVVNSSSNLHDKARTPWHEQAWQLTRWNLVHKNFSFLCSFNDNFTLGMLQCQSRHLPFSCDNANSAFRNRLEYYLYRGVHNRSVARNVSHVELLLPGKSPAN